MNTSSRIPILAALLASAILSAMAFSSCDNEFGIIDSIQTEKKQAGTNLFRNTTVTKVLSFKGAIYASSSRLYSRASTGGSWSVVSVGPLSSYTALSMAATAANLYVAVLESAGSGKVYGFDGSSWTEIGQPTDIATPDTFLVDALFSAGAEIYAQAHITDSAGASSYSLYRLSGGAFTTVVANLSRINSPVVGVAERATGDFWFVSRGTSSSTTLTAKVMRGTAANAGTDKASDAGMAAGTKVNRIAVGGTVLYLGATDGTLYAYDGASWSSGKPGGDAGLPLGAIALVNGKLLVGTDTVSSSDAADGYYEGSSGGSVVGWTFASGADGVFALSSSVYSTTISGKPVLDFMLDGSTLYACLAPGASGGIYGLYATTLAGGVWTGWTAE